MEEFSQNMKIFIQVFKRAAPPTQINSVSTRVFIKKGFSAFCKQNMERERETTKMLKDNEENIKRIQNLRVKEKTLLDLKLDEKKKKKKSIEVKNFWIFILH